MVYIYDINTRGRYSDPGLYIQNDSRNMFTFIFLFNKEIIQIVYIKENNS
jgi:hypothetical protein